MFRMIFLFLFFFTPSFMAEASVEDALDSLLAVPWTKSPTSLPDSAAWKIEPYTDLTTFELQGYNLRAFFRDNGSFRTKLFTYAEPSLTSFRETILMGYIQATVQTEEEAKGIHGKMLIGLKSRGFESMPPDTTRDAVMLRMMYKGSEMFRKGKMNGCTYYVKDDRANCWYARTSISHPRFQEFKNKSMAALDHWSDYHYTMPDKLIKDLESGKVSGLLTPALWDSIKNMPSFNFESFWRGEYKFPLDRLVSAYETIDRRNLSGKNLSAALLFKNYLVRYLFMNGWSKEMTAEQKKWLETHGLSYMYSELGLAYINGESNLWNLIEKYPDSYWGQFAFLELLMMGFDTTGMCRTGNDQWSMVLEKGPVFLEKYPDSEFAPDVRFYIGTAAETLFNLGVMEQFGPREDKSIEYYSDKREGARKQAIKCYEEVLQSPQKGKYENHLKYTLPRLRAGFGTGCDYYFCFYD